MADPFESLHRRDHAAIPTRSDDVTPDDDADLPTLPLGLWIGGGGDLVVRLKDDSDDDGERTFKNVPSGCFIPGRVRRVMAATTCTDIVAVW